MIRPPRLEPGQVVGIVSPSWGGAGAFPQRTAQGVRALEGLGYRVRIGQYALNQRGHVSDSAAHRVADLHAMFRDPEVGAIVAAIGGDHACHLLPHLDHDLIAAHPTILTGFSDITVLNLAIWTRCALVTFNGPALLTDFAEAPAMFDYTRDHFLRVVSRPEAAGPIHPAPAWTEERMEWADPETVAAPRSLKPSPGWQWLRAGRAEGPLIGGCLESMQHLRGTPDWPDFDGAILFIETSEESPSPATVDGILMDYENMGVLQQISALLVGRPMGYTDHQKAQLREILLERTAPFDLAVVSDMDFGHTSPQFTLPIGVRARVDSDRRCFEIIEPAVS